MTHRIHLREAGAADALRSMAPDPHRAMRQALRALAEDPTGRTNRLDVKPLLVPPSTPATYRLRVGNYRAVFFVQGRDVYVLRIFHRETGYRWLGD